MASAGVQIMRREIWITWEELLMTQDNNYSRSDHIWSVFHRYGRLRWFGQEPRILMIFGMQPIDEDPPDNAVGRIRHVQQHVMLEFGTGYFERLNNPR